MRGFVRVKEFSRSLRGLNLNFFSPFLSVNVHFSY